MPTDKVSVKTFCLGLLIALSTPALRAQNFIERTPLQHTPKRVWIRRATLVAGCAASLAFDTVSTRRAVASGAVETNGLLAGSQGRPQWGRVIGFKAGLCGIFTIFQETNAFNLWKTPSADWTWIAINAGTASVYTFAGIHNLNTANELSANVTKK